MYNCRGETTPFSNARQALFPFIALGVPFTSTAITLLYLMIVLSLLYSDTQAYARTYAALA